MLIHIVPKLFEPPFCVESEVVDVSIPELGLVLDGGKEITARRVDADRKLTHYS
ncbi:DUF6012 family protein [Iodobacter sp. CM08]|uniref:DUF6012 family protein n=1 Tax=Iodobacter sp. CM08 TaxID=3085902 RepID=UPI002980D97B|nr:DUF6012 family protein [Iodobacter sp. CM08]MDW5418722.1 DUF6012 family protein [Iodobacter sp. CM08]